MVVGKHLNRNAQCHPEDPHQRRSQKARKTGSEPKALRATLERPCPAFCIVTLSLCATQKHGLFGSGSPCSWRQNTCPQKPPPALKQAAQSSQGDNEQNRTEPLDCTGSGTRQGSRVDYERDAPGWLLDAGPVKHQVPVNLHEQSRQNPQPKASG